MREPNIYAVLLAGGSGTRLWPVSRELFPKQLVSFFGTDSLVQNTIRRLLPVISKDRIRVVCGKEHFHEISRHMTDIGVPAEGKILSEPCGRNTAPAILLAIKHIRKTDPECVIFVFPADHVVHDVHRFQESLQSAIRLARDDFIVTFGITPNYPETGYGYIEGADPIPDGGLRIRRFVEKPDLDTARGYLEAGNFFWNSGMFAFSGRVMEEECRRHCPDLFDATGSLSDTDQEISEEMYAGLPNISIDYAVMEKTRKGAVLPSDFGWSDIGSWKSLYDFLPKDENGNVLSGDVITQHTRGCFIMGYERLIATSHIQDMVVVETPDSVFVSDMSNSRDVKSIVTRLKQEGREEYQRHRTVHFPWGSRTLLEHNSGYRADRLRLFPGAQIQCASPQGTISHLVILKGEAKFRKEDTQRILKSGENAIIPERETVELVNGHSEVLELIQVQCDF